MRRRFRLIAPLPAALLALWAIQPVTGSASADRSASAVYVAPSGVAGAPDRSCASAAFSSIAAAVAAVPAHHTVMVCAGTYQEDVLVEKPLNLIGEDATIDATGLENGIQVVRSGVLVRGFTIENANGEGILVGIDSFADIGLLPPSGPVISNVTIAENQVLYNDQGFTGTESGNCKYPGDCGGGIHLNATANSMLRGNVVEHNVDGLLLTDDYGPNHGNKVLNNVVDYNASECGITLPSHSGDAVTYDPATFAVTGLNRSLGGVYDNLVRGNIADFNGTNQAPPEFGGGGSGAGIGLFGAGPGSAVYDNVVVGNEAHGNGLAGITIHAHHPGGEYMNGNVLTGNDLGTNNVMGDPFDGPPVMNLFNTAGINIFSVPAISMTVSNNRIHDNVDGIWMSTVVTAAGLPSNRFSNVADPLVTG